MKSFIRNRSKPEKESSDDDAPPTDTFDFEDHEEEIVPIQAKPFLFGDKWYLINMLPITEYRATIQKLVQEHSVCIITGETGSGKST